MVTPKYRKDAIVALDFGGGRIVPECIVLDVSVIAGARAEYHLAVPTSPNGVTKLEAVDEALLLDEVAPENLLSPDVLRATIAELEETLAKGKEDSEEEIKNLKESVASLEQELGQANETNEGLNKTIASFGATKAEGNNTPQVGGEVPGDVEQKP